MLMIVLNNEFVFYEFTLRELKSYFYHFFILIQCV